MEKFKLKVPLQDSSLLVGKRMRAFRERKKLSQLKLETEVGLSNGTISLFESGKVNPTKETLVRIADILNLSMKERMFLFDWISIAPSEEEIHSARQEVSRLVNNPFKLGYLVDERSGIWAVSKGFRILMGVSDLEYQKLLGKNLFEFIFDPSLPAYKFIHGPNFESMAKFQLARHLKEIPFWDVDPYCYELFKKLEKFPEFNKVFRSIQLDPFDLLTLESRTVSFLINKRKFSLVYSREYLKSNSRFFYTEYAIGKTLINLLKNR